MNKPTTIDLSVLRQALGSIPNSAEWKYMETEENLPGGGSLTKEAGYVRTAVSLEERSSA